MFSFVYPGWIPRCNLLVQTDFSNSTGNNLGNFASERNLSNWIVSFFISIFSWLVVFAYWILSLLLVFENIKVIYSQLFLCCFHFSFHPFKYMYSTVFIHLQQYMPTCTVVAWLCYFTKMVTEGGSVTKWLELDIVINGFSDKRP